MDEVRWAAVTIALGLLAGAAARSAVAQDAGHGPCASTAAGALQAKSVAPAGTPAGGQEHGYRVESVRWDPLLRQSWAVVGSCDHPERPSVTMLTDLPAPSGAFVSPAGGGGTGTALRQEAAVTVVRAGDAVRLWKMDATAHIEMMATAEENGAVGARVRVRLPAPRDADGQVAGQPQYLAGVVRGPGDVEMER